MNDEPKRLSGTNLTLICHHLRGRLKGQIEADKHTAATGHLTFKPKFARLVDNKPE